MAQRLDPETRAGMLCYLVVAQLVARARTGYWLQTCHLAESAHLWLCANEAQCGSSERLQLAHMSAEIAAYVHGQFFPKDEAFLARLFIDGWRLDYRSAVVQDIHDLCATHLAIP